MSEQAVLFEVRDHVAEITLNRPNALNALNLELREQLFEALNRVETDPDIRVAIITGAGRAFCAGGDVKLMGQRAATGEETGGRAQIERLRDIAFQIPVRLVSMDKPTIAAVNGVAVGWGCDLVAACDIQIASDQARFGQAFVKRGLVPDGGSTWTLPRLIGRGNALRMMLTGDLIDAAEAKEIGLVTQVVPADDLLPTAREMAVKIANNAPLAVQLTKRAVSEAANLTMPQAMQQMAGFNGITRISQDHREGVQSFLEKRDARFVAD